MAKIDHKIGPRSAQEGSKRLLKSHFFALKNCLKICSVLGPILVVFGSLWGGQKLGWCPPCWVWKLMFFGHVIFVTFESPLSWPKRRPRRPRGPQTPPRAPREAPRGRQERSRRSKKASGDRKSRPRRPQDIPKMPNKTI